MVRHNIPCASLTVTRNGHIVVDRAYGYRDPSRTAPLPTGMLFRIASLDKLVFATAAERMIAEGVIVGPTHERFTRDLKIFASLRRAGVLGTELADVDPRLYEVTIGQMLEHRSGIAVTYPDVKKVQEFLRVSRLPTSLDMLKYRVHGKLKYDPGAQWEYNNTANEMLWAIMQWINGGWAETVGKYVFTPAGTNGFGLSKTRPRDRSPQEVWYATARMARSIFPEDCGALLPVTDGGGMSFDSTLITSSAALARYLSTWYMGTGRPLVDSRGELAPGNDNGLGIYYGGWDGTWTMALQRRWTLTNVVVLFNHREERAGVKETDLGQAFSAVLDRLGW